MRNKDLDIFPAKPTSRNKALSDSTEEIDPKWVNLQNSNWICSSCQNSHHGIMDLSSAKPDAWKFDDDIDPEKLFKEQQCALSSDQCMIDGKDYFIRCMLYLPIKNSNGDRFGFGVWSSLSKQNFFLYDEIFRKVDIGDIRPWFGWFSNSLKGYPETLSLKCSVQPNPSSIRPTITLEPGDHPLAMDQANGITMDRLLEIYAANGHKLSV